MKGVNYLVDDSGRKTAVILDLRKHRRVWEDIYDRLLIEPRQSLEQVRKQLTRGRRAKSHA